MPSKTWSGTICEMEKRGGRGSLVVGKIRRSDGKIVNFSGNLMKGVDLGMEVEFYYDTARKTAFDIRRAQTRWPGDYQRQRR